MPVAGITIKKNYGDSAAASGEVAYVTKISTLLGEDSGVLNRFAGVVELRRR